MEGTECSCWKESRGKVRKGRTECSCSKESRGKVRKGWMECSCSKESRGKVPKGRSVLVRRSLEGWCGTDGVFLSEGVSRDGVKGTDGVFLLEGVFLNKHQQKNKNQDRQISKDMKMRIFAMWCCIVW